LSSFLGLFLILQSCESKKSYISKFDEFVSETSTNYKNFSETEWAKADSTFAHFEKEYSNKWNKDLTTDENAHINELKGKYQALKVKSGIEDMKNELNDIIEQSKSFVKELISDTTDNK
jgi:hypothetical protein